MSVRFTFDVHQHRQVDGLVPQEAHVTLGHDHLHRRPTTTIRYRWLSQEDEAVCMSPVARTCTRKTLPSLAIARTMWGLHASEVLEQQYLHDGSDR